MSESLRDCVNTTQDDVSKWGSSDPNSVRITSGDRCEDRSFAHDEKCPKEKICPNHFAIA